MDWDLCKDIIVEASIHDLGFISLSQNGVYKSIDETNEYLALKNKWKKIDKTISGLLTSYAGTVTNAAGAEKAFTITNLAIVVDDKNIAVTYSLKYGNMPMSMETTLIGTKK